MGKKSAWQIMGFKSKCAYQKHLIKEFKKAFPEKVKYLNLKKGIC